MNRLFCHIFLVAVAKSWRSRLIQTKKFLSTVAVRCYVTFVIFLVIFGSLRKMRWGREICDIYSKKEYSNFILKLKFKVHNTTTVPYKITRRALALGWTKLWCLFLSLILSWLISHFTQKKISRYASLPEFWNVRCQNVFPSTSLHVFIRFHVQCLNLKHSDLKRDFGYQVLVVPPVFSKISISENRKKMLSILSVLLSSC